MARITGDDQHRRRLRAMRAVEMAQAIGAAVFVEAQAMQVDAQLSISEGAVSGKNHAASNAPDPPNNDSGVLAGNIEAVMVGPLKAEISSNAPYAAIQEFGGTVDNAFGKGISVTLPERPHMRPAAERAKSRASRKISAAVRKQIRRAT